MNLSREFEDLAHNDLPTSGCPTCHGKGRRHLPEAGKILRAKRIDAGLRLRTMARELAVSPQQIADWESGRLLVPVDVPERWEGVCRQLGRVLPVRQQVVTTPAATAAAKESPMRQDTDEAPRLSSPGPESRGVAGQPQGRERMMREQQEKRGPKAHTPLAAAPKTPEAPGWERMLENQR